MRNINIAAIVSAVIALAGGSVGGAYVGSQAKPDEITLHLPDWACTKASADGNVIRCVRLSAL
ncbi:hypothetical protein y223_00043 [Bordetella phage PY223]